MTSDDARVFSSRFVTSDDLFLSLGWTSDGLFSTVLVVMMGLLGALAVRVDDDVVLSVIIAVVADHNAGGTRVLTSDGELLG